MAIPLASCSGDLSTLDPAGPSARAIATLWWIMLVGGTAIFIATCIALLLAATKPRVLGTQPSRTLVLWGGIVLPSIILVVLVASAFVLGERLLAAPGSEGPLRIEAQGRQWMWEFRYPEAGGVTTSDELHIPAGRAVEFTVTSGDVIHSFWVPRLGGKIDAIPGHENTILLTADRPGTFGGVCAEYCGTGHGPMTFRVVAHAPEDYDAALAKAAAGGTP